MRKIKQGVARDILIFMTDATDHIAGKAGLTLTITASKNAGAFAAITPVVTDQGSGWYALALTAAHTNTLGDLGLHITATGADPTDTLLEVVAYDAMAATNLGLTNLDAAVTSRMATFSYTAPDNATITAINAKTTNLPASPASETTLVSVGNALVTVGNNVSDVKAVTVKIDTALILDGSVYQFTGNALENAPVTDATTAADIRDALGMAAADLDDQLDALSSLTTSIDTKVDVTLSSRLASTSYVAPDNAGIGTLLSGVAAIYGDTHTALPAQIGALSIPTAAAIADAVHDETVDGAYTFRQSMRLINSAMWGIVSGAATNEVVFRDVSDTKNRIVADVDENGNRTDVEVDPS